MWPSPLWSTLVPFNKALFSVVPPDSSLTWFKIECGKFCASTVLYKENFLTCKMSVMAGLSWQFDEIQNHLQGGGASGILLRGSLVVFIEKGRHSPQWAVPFPRLKSWTTWEGKSKLSTSIHEPLLLDFGYDVTSCLISCSFDFPVMTYSSLQLWSKMNPFPLKLLLS